MLETLRKVTGVAIVSTMLVFVASSANAALISPDNSPVALLPGTVLTSIQTFEDGDTVDDTYNYQTVDLESTGFQNVSYRYSIIFANQEITDFANLTFSLSGSAQGPNFSTFTLTDSVGEIIPQFGLNFVAGVGFALNFVGNWIAPQDIALNVTGEALADGATYGVRISAVPLPAPLVLLVTALVGMGFLGRRKLSV